jgi:hypothetical protein
MIYTLATIELVATKIRKVHALLIHECTGSRHLMNSILVAYRSITAHCGKPGLKRAGGDLSTASRAIVTVQRWRKLKVCLELEGCLDVSGSSG